MSSDEGQVVLLLPFNRFPHPICWFSSFFINNAVLLFPFWNLSYLKGDFSFWSVLFFFFFLHLPLILTLPCCTFNWSSSVKCLFINLKKLICSLLLKCFEHFIWSLWNSLQLQKRINQFQVEDINYFACLICADSIYINKCGFN